MTDNPSKDGLVERLELIELEHQPITVVVNSMRMYQCRCGAGPFWDEDHEQHVKQVSLKVLTEEAVAVEKERCINTLWEKKSKVLASPITTNAELNTKYVSVVAACMDTLRHTSTPNHDDVDRKSVV